MAHQNRKGGFTIVELLVVVSIIALLIALLLPAVQRGRDRALTSNSIANLKNLAAAAETYAGDWGERQFTAVPDDAGTVAGGDTNANCTNYVAQIACPPSQILGYDIDGGLWAYWINCGGIGAGSCNNWVVNVPYTFTGGSRYGAFRIPNVKAFNAYVGERYYDKTFWAPKDTVLLNTVERFFQTAAEFTTVVENGSQVYEDSSYCWSPAAMWDASVLGKGLNNPNLFYNNPATLKAAHRSPPVTRCKHPTLKTRMIEHNWLQNTPDSPVNPNFAGGSTPWQFNHGFNSAPACLFFDGHIELVGCRKAQTSDERGGQLWSRNTPTNNTGYANNLGYDNFVNTAFHILTKEGIEGRDVLGAEG